MGCDIHIYVEKNTKNGWEAIERAPIDQDWNPGDEPVLEGFLYDCRDYTFFSILADVRNYDGLKPISHPRDIPKDLSVKVYEKFLVWQEDAHSCSWYSFKELIDYDWDSHIIEYKGYLTPHMYKVMKESEYDDVYPIEQLSLTDSIVVSNSKMQEIIAINLIPKSNSQYYTYCEFTKTHRDKAKYFLDNLNSFIQNENIQYQELEDYRVVFWFDN